MAEEKILVVDDEASIREAAQRFLTLAGYTVTTAAGGAEALEACGQSGFALVLTDLKMPGMNGEELLERIKEITPTTDVIIMTAYPTLESAIQTFKAGACDYLLKPFELAELEKVVQRCLERQRLRRELDVERQLRQKLEDLNRANARLYAEVEPRRAELQRLSAKLRRAQESERQRIARELHDGVAQTLSGLFMHLDLLDNMVESLPPARECLRQIKTLVEQALEEVRGLVWTLRPTVLDDLGLPDALRGLVANLSQSVPTDIVLHIDENLSPLPSAVETALYRIVQEALSNVFQHARASLVRVHLGAGDGALQLRVADNGQGIGSTDATSQGKLFDRADHGPQTADRRCPGSGRPSAVGRLLQDRRGIGLWSMRERAEEVGGRFSLRSSPGQGTTILVTIPLETMDAPS